MTDWSWKSRSCYEARRNCFTTTIYLCCAFSMPSRSRRRGRRRGRRRRRRRRRCWRCSRRRQICVDEIPAFVGDLLTVLEAVAPSLMRTVEAPRFAPRLFIFLEIGVLSVSLHETRVQAVEITRGGEERTDHLLWPVGASCIPVDVMHPILYPLRNEVQSPLRRLCGCRLLRHCGKGRHSRQENCAHSSSNELALCQRPLRPHLQ